MNIKFSYLYRDGGNYKNFNEIIFANPTGRSKEEIEHILSKHLIDGRWFYCTEWNIPDIHFTEFQYDEEIDVDWHEFESIEETTDPPKEENSLEAFLLIVQKTKLPW